MVERDPWVQVKDESELREGMTVKLVRRDGRPCRIMLFRRAPDPNRLQHAWHEGPCPTWSIPQQRLLCPLISIREGRLYRLADSETIDDTEVREKETVDS